jgi:hypothetical protein
VPRRTTAAEAGAIDEAGEAKAAVERLGHSTKALTIGWRSQHDRERLRRRKNLTAALGEAAIRPRSGGAAALACQYQITTSHGADPPDGRTNSAGSLQSGKRLRREDRSKAATRG